MNENSVEFDSFLKRVYSLSSNHETIKKTEQERERERLERDSERGCKTQ